VRVHHDHGVKSWTIPVADIRFGPDDKAPVARDLVRLAPLPSAGSPVALYLGVLANGRGAAFLLSPGVTASGEGRCVPRRRICTQLVLEPGQDEVLTTPDGATHHLQVAALHSRSTRSQAVAQRAYERVSAKGRCIADEVLAYDFDSGTGTLRSAHPLKGCRYVTAHDAARPGAR
jgi:hypothetical protein